MPGMGCFWPTVQHHNWRPLRDSILGITRMRFEHQVVQAYAIDSGALAALRVCDSWSNVRHFKELLLRFCGNLRRHHCC